MDCIRMTSVGNTLTGHGMGKTQYSIGSIHDRSYEFNTNALVVKRIAEIAPSHDVRSHNWKHLFHLELANPQFLESHKIDLLLGAAVYAEVVLGNVIKGQPGEPIAQSTKLGYIVFGPARVNGEFKICNTLQANQFNEPADDLSQSSKREEVEDFDTTFKTLGITGKPSTDMFQFNSSTSNQTEQWTKREILFEIAKLLDPLHWLTPRFTEAKTLMQDTWRRQLNWNSGPPHIAARWQPMHTQMCMPIAIQVPRWMGLTNDTCHVEFHGFCDASAFAALVSIQARYSEDSIVCNLVASKNKSASIKTVTIPRLKLCGAMPLSKLLHLCVQTLAHGDNPIHAWSASKRVLSWLAVCPNRWSVYVISVHPTNDILIRSVDIQCGKTSIRRPTHELASSLIPDNDQIERFAQRGENLGDRE